jgi:hypothetical protein
MLQNLFFSNLALDKLNLLLIQEQRLPLCHFLKLCRATTPQLLLTVDQAALRTLLRVV